MLATATSSPLIARMAGYHTSVNWRQMVEPAEAFLKAVTQRLHQQITEFDPGIEAFAEYALTGQGKQLRPLLVALGARATGQCHDQHVTVAVIIEMAHLATLVHDDVMDEAEIRRGRRTLAANWGNETAVLLGDCLFAHALKLAASFPTPEVCRAVASATNTVCSGEILQTRRRNDFGLSLKDYYKILEMKTAELFALSCELGGFLNGATESQRTNLRQFGLALGTAYQLYDDCVDIFGSETEAGKSLGTDLAKGKLTLPVLLLRERSDPEERIKLRKLIQNWEPGELAKIRQLLAAHEIAGESLAVIQEQLEKARQISRKLPEGQKGLGGLTEYLARQTAEALDVLCATPA